MTIDIYDEAAEKLGWPGSASCINYLKVLFTPEEGKLLLDSLGRQLAPR